MAKLLIALSPLFLLFTCSLKHKPDAKIVRYEYSIHGSMAQPIHQFTVEKINDKTCRLSYFNHDREFDSWDSMHDKDGNFVLDTSKEPIALLDSIQQIFVEHKMWTYKKNYQPTLQVLDGNSWSLNITLDDGTSYSSSGYHSKPKDDGIDVIINMLKRKFNGI